ncbi:MAG: hypothetical protein D6797_06365 [Bdellovibrio sp.]|nr:MAG: hypothetical protein D6797_06365 [Bdellovibrio sp.]
MKALTVLLLSFFSLAVMAKEPEEFKNNADHFKMVPPNIITRTSPQGDLEFLPLTTDMSSAIKKDPQKLFQLVEKNKDKFLKISEAQIFKNLDELDQVSGSNSWYFYFYYTPTPPASYGYYPYTTYYPVYYYSSYGYYYYSPYYYTPYRGYTYTCFY